MQAKQRKNFIIFSAHVTKEKKRMQNCVCRRHELLVTHLLMKFGSYV